MSECRCSKRYVLPTHFTDWLTESFLRRDFLLVKILYLHEIEGFQSNDDDSVFWFVTLTNRVTIPGISRKHTAFIFKVQEVLRVF